MAEARRAEPHRPGRPLIRAAGDNARRSLYVSPNRPPVQLIDVENPFEPGTTIKVKRVGYDYLAAMFKRKVINGRQYSAGRKFDHLCEVAKGLNVLQGVDPTRDKVDTSHKPRSGINRDKLRAEEQLDGLKREIGARTYDLVYRVLVRGLKIPEAMLDRDGLDWEDASLRVYDDPKRSFGEDVADIGKADTLPSALAPIHYKHLVPNENGFAIDQRSAAMTAAKVATATHRTNIKINDRSRADMVDVTDVLTRAQNNHPEQINDADYIGLGRFRDSEGPAPDASQSIDTDTDGAGPHIKPDARMAAGYTLAQAVEQLGPHTARDRAKHKYGERAIEAEGQRLQDGMSDIADFFENDREGSNY